MQINKNLYASLCEQKVIAGDSSFRVKVYKHSSKNGTSSEQEVIESYIKRLKLWVATTTDIIEFVYGTNDVHLTNFRAATIFNDGGNPYDEIDKVYTQGENVLEQIIDSLSKIYPELEEQQLNSWNMDCPNSNEIFIVHGRDDGIKNEVARFLEKAGLKPIILHECPNEGMTVIEKFEKYSNVNFAIVLLTPDDKGGLNETPFNEKLRARQNVIFELGYFCGKLGRNKVVAIIKDEVEQPSDIVGITYISYREWKNQTLRELKKAGYNFDMNVLLNM